MWCATVAGATRSGIAGPGIVGVARMSVRSHGRRWPPLVRSASPEDHMPHSITIVIYDGFASKGPRDHKVDLLPPKSS